jgi:hypothetical protein
MMHAKSYEPITDLLAMDAGVLDRHSVDSHPATFTVTGVVAVPAEVRPVGITIDGGDTYSLTLEQSAQLRARLLAAESDARAGGPPVIAASGDERCDGCGESIAAGAPVVVDVVDPDERLVFHLGCVGEERGDG